MLGEPLSARDERAIVDVLATKTISGRILDAMVVDLATADWSGAVRWAYRRNLAARDDGPPRHAIVTSNTSRLIWLLLAVRANYAADFVDLSHAGLASDLPLVGQSANLSNVDFTASVLTGATWRGSNLTKARFRDARVAGALRCTDCTFGNQRYGGTATLIDGKWSRR